jgi:hypothetical protein
MAPNKGRQIMTEGFRTPPPAGPAGYAGSAPTHEQEVRETVDRIMGEDIAPPPASQDPTRANGEGPTGDVAKRQAAKVGDTAKQAGAQVAGTAAEQAGQVAEEAKNQAKQLLLQAQSELSEQAASTQQRVAEGLHALADEFSGMARNSEQDGVATDLARQAADRARSAAGWLADREPGSLLEEVRIFARKKPGTYLALALGAGVLAGRLTRGLTAPADQTPSGSTAGAQLPSSQVDTGQHRLYATPPVDPTGYALNPVTDPVPPVSGLGASGGFGGRGAVAP